MTISASAGTMMSWVTQRTTSSGRPDIAPATSYSHMSLGMRVTAA
jgi:hypothetical protein